MGERKEEREPVRCQSEGSCRQSRTNKTGKQREQYRDEELDEKGARKQDEGLTCKLKRDSVIAQTVTSESMALHLHILQPK